MLDVLHVVVQEMKFIEDVVEEMRFMDAVTGMKFKVHLHEKMIVFRIFVIFFLQVASDPFFFNKISDVRSYL